MTASEIQTAISLIPSTDNTKSVDAESNIDISGDEDDFDDVFLIENGEVFRQDVDAILAALEEAARERDGDLLDSVPLNLPEPPSCFADESRSLFNDHHVSKNDSCHEWRVMKPVSLVDVDLRMLKQALNHQVVVVCYGSMQWTAAMTTQIWLDAWVFQYC